MLTMKRKMMMKRNQLKKMKKLRDKKNRMTLMMMKKTKKMKMKIIVKMGERGVKNSQILQSLPRIKVECRNIKKLVKIINMNQME